MFQLHDRMRRQIARVLFFLLCLAPTVAVSAWCVSVRLPGHARDEAERLGLQLGVKVSLESVRYPRPGIVRYEGLVLSDPETGKRILACRELEASWASSLLMLMATQPEIEAGALETLHRLVERVLVTRAGWPEINVQLKAGEVAVRSPAGPQVFTGVDGRIRILPEGTLAQVKFGVSGEAMREPVQFYIGRRQDVPPTTVIGLTTGGATLPCSVLGLVLPEIASLGPASRFSGEIRAYEAPEGWACEVAGDFLNVDLAQLVGRRFPPHQLAGSADLKIASASLLDGRLQSATGLLYARSGKITRLLLEAATAAMNLRGMPENDTPPELPYDRLAFRFRIDSQGMQMQGACDSEGTVFASCWARIQEADERRPIPLATIVQRLLPSGDTGTVSSSLSSLQRRLPVPEFFPPVIQTTALRAGSSSPSDVTRRQHWEPQMNADERR